MNTRHTYPFEKLRVWQDSRELVKNVYAITRQFPKSEIYGFTSQTNRAAVSVTTNIAEGSARISRKDQAHFSEIAYSSLTELACLSILAVDLEYLAASRESQLRERIEGISWQLNALRNSQLSR